MRPQQLAALFAFLSLGYLVAADIDIDHDDVDKRECWDVCKPIVRLSHDCDHKYDDNDRAELNCVCSGPDARTLIPLCEACVAKYDDDDDDDDRHDNDVYELLTSCSLQTTTWNTASASSILNAMSTGSTTATRTSGPNEVPAVTTVPADAATQPTTGAASAVIAPQAGLLAMVLGAFLGM
ncbi:hypothetical protein VTN00DRAFT_4841 [Thermoascus crustaceus]|uniref:uncharacterized protein n=1 Tax=Thermoascus crustaceus TaxID=5088 RepID=UPI003743036D